MLTRAGSISKMGFAFWAFLWRIFDMPFNFDSRKHLFWKPRIGLALVNLENRRPRLLASKSNNQNASCTSQLVNKSWGKCSVQIMQGWKEKSSYKPYQEIEDPRRSTGKVKKQWNGQLEWSQRSWVVTWGNSNQNCTILCLCCGRWRCGKELG